VNERALRAVGFLLLVLGLGLRLDTTWQGFAWLLILAGAAVAGMGLWLLATRPPSAGAFVPPPGRG